MVPDAHALRSLTLDAPAQAPRGTVALVFTDIEGSTRLWERLGDEFRAILGQHDRCLRTCIDEHGGYEVKTEGDAFFVAFATARAAVAFCVDAQLRLHTTPWPDALCRQPDAATEPGFHGVRVRMGVHLGVPIATRDPTTGRADYLGPVVNRAARVASRARGGEILVSEAVMHALRDGPPGGVRVEDLGTHALRGLDRPEHLWRLVPCALEARRFGGAAPERPRTNLVVATRAFVGRTAERDALETQVANGTVTTITGPAGVGKSALAAEWARARTTAPPARPAFPGGVWRVALAGVRSATELHRALADALSAEGADVLEATRAALRERGRALVLFDDADFVARDLARLLPTLLADPNGATFLVTARAPIGVGTALPLAPLGVTEGCALYRLRAAAAGGRCPAVTTADTAWDRELALLVEELDGLPLAIELAAAHARALGPAAVRARIAQHQQLLNAATDVDPRHASLEGAMAWSWELLREGDRVALARMCAFEQAFSMEDAEAVTRDESTPVPIQSITRLLGQGLLREDADERLATLRAVRVFVFARAPVAVRDEAFRRHADRLGRWGTFDATESLSGVEGPTLRARLSRDAPDLLVALRRMIGAGDGARAAPLAVAASEVLHLRGPVNAADDAYDALIDGRLSQPRGRSRLMLLRARGWSRSMTGRLTDARADFAQGLTEADAADDAVMAARLRNDLATVDAQAGDLRAAEDGYAEAIARAARADDDAAGIAARGNLAMSLRDRGLLAEARLLLVIAARHARRRGDVTRAAQVQHVLGTVLLEEGDAAAAATVLTEAIRDARALGDAHLEAQALGDRADAKLALGEDTEALSDARAAVERAQRGAWTARASVWAALEALLLARTARPDDARDALARADEWLARAGVPYFATRTHAWATLAHVALGEHPQAHARAEHLHGEDARTSPLVARALAAVAAL